MTAIADAELQKLFNKFALAYARAAVEADIEPDNAYDWGSSEARDAFCAALNERLEAAERMAEALRWIGQGGNTIEASQDYVTVLESTAKAALAAYRQSKEHRA